MATGRGDGPVNDRDVEEWEDERPRSLLNATWFRVLVVVLVIGAVAAVAIPYLMNLTGAPRPVARVPAAPPTQEAPPPVAQAPAAPATAPATPTDPAAPATPGAPAPSAPPAAPAETPVAQVPPPEAAKPAPAQPPAPTATSDAPKPAPDRAATTRQPQDAKPARAAAPAGSGAIWVQVGAFRDPAAAQRLAASLKEKGFTVAETSGAPTAPTATPATGGRSDRYDVVVGGSPAPDLVQRLSGKGLSAERTADGVIIRPSLPLRDAVALSNNLRTEGFKVTVRRVSGGTPAAAPAVATGDTLHRVRVGAFPDRAAAREAVQKLEALGYKPFISRGP